MSLESALRLLVAGAALAALGWSLVAGLGHGLRVLRGRRYAARGRAGERRARALLEAAGYRVLAEQPRRRVEVRVDGRPRDVVLVPDFLCERGGVRFVADAKTGAGRDPGDPATRRQLLEYVVWFEAEAALLVDVPAGRVRRVELLPPRRAQRWALVTLALACAAIAGFAWPLAPSWSYFAGSAPK